jgi:hypothetical protein
MCSCTKLACNTCQRASNTNLTRQCCCCFSNQHVRQRKANKPARHATATKNPFCQYLWQLQPQASTAKLQEVCCMQLRQPYLCAACSCASHTLCAACSCASHTLCAACSCASHTLCAACSCASHTLCAACSCRPCPNCSCCCTQYVLATQSTRPSLTASDGRQATVLQDVQVWHTFAARCKICNPLSLCSCCCKQYLLLDTLQLDHKR